MKISKYPLYRFACVVSVLLVSACGSSIKLEKPLALSEEAITDARSAGAEQYAPLSLDNAETKLTKAQEAIQEDERETANRLLSEAILDARLAEAKSESAKKQKAVEELRAGNQALIKEITD